MEQIYIDGLESWKRRRDLLKEAKLIECSICSILNCRQWYGESYIEEYGKLEECGKPSPEANDCPVKNYPKLCEEMACLALELSILYDKISGLVWELEELHSKLPEERNK